MAKLTGGKHKGQESSRPEGWLAASIVVPLELTGRLFDFIFGSVSPNCWAYVRAGCSHHLLVKRAKFHDRSWFISDNPEHHPFSLAEHMTIFGEVKWCGRMF